MDKKDYGKIATCGVNGQQVTVSRYNFNCPCLNCVDCNGDEKQPCGWRHTLETNPCTDEELRALICQNCIKITNENQR